MDEKDLKEARRLFAQSGGRATLKKKGATYFKELSKKAVEARKKIKKDIKNKKQ